MTAAASTTILHLFRGFMSVIAHLFPRGTLQDVEVASVATRGEEEEEEGNLNLIGSMGCFVSSSCPQSAEKFKEIYRGSSY